MTRLALDTAVLVHAIGGEHPLRAPCRRVLELAGRERFAPEASVELVQELVHQRHRRTGDRRVAAEAGRWGAALVRLHPFDEQVLDRSLGLYERHARLKARDAVHAATALIVRLPAIVTPDRDFDGIDGLERVDPRDEGRLAELTGA